MTDAQILADLQAVLARALDVARAAPPQTADRKAHQDFVTDVDRAVDAVLEQELAGVLPGTPVLSEERAVAVEGPLARYWIVDPIDGTLNLMSGLPPSAIACALVDAQGPRIGAVVDIQSGRTYTAIRGAGAWRDGRAIRASAIARSTTFLTATSPSALAASCSPTRSCVRRARPVVSLSA